MAAQVLASDPLVLLLALAFLPALLYLAGLSLRHPGPSARLAVPGFVYGATLSLVVLLGLYVLLFLFLGDPARAFQGFFAERSINENAERGFLVIVVIAPLLEEAAKGFGVWLLGSRLTTRRDGVMLGASIGLGFAAVETFTYLVAALADAGSEVAGVPLFDLALLAGLRSITAAFMHPAATGLTGYGIARVRVRGRSLLAVVPFFVLAVALHGVYNYIAAFLPPQEIGGVPMEVNLPLALLMAFFAWGFVKRGVRSRA